jgi:hypothetical protein
MIYSDRTLSQTIERTEARVNVDFIETRAKLEPEHGAAWIDVGGAYAMFDGVGSPLSQTFGLGLFEDATAGHLDEIEAFYRERNSPAFHEVSPMADPSLLELLTGRGYHPVELTTGMFRELGAAIEKRGRIPGLTTRVVGEDESGLWAKTSADAWSFEHKEIGEFMRGFGSISARCAGSFPFIAELKGQAIATGMLFIYDDVCVLAGASTVLSGRNQGAQTALLEDRLELAASKGCRLAVMAAHPGSQSQRNAQKNAFQIAYTRIKWRKVG